MDFDDSTIGGDATGNDRVGGDQFRAGRDIYLRIEEVVSATRRIADAADSGELAAVAQQLLSLARHVRWLAAVPTVQQHRLVMAQLDLLMEMRRSLVGDDFGNQSLAQRLDDAAQERAEMRMAMKAIDRKFSAGIGVLVVAILLAVIAALVVG